MGSIKMLVCVMVVTMAGLATKVQANYHVSKWVRNHNSGTFEACPSNYYNCKCYRVGDRRGKVSQKPPSLTNFFTIANLCGYQKLDHYHNNDGTYSVFVAGGDGKVVATCYGADKDRVTIKCPIPKDGGEGVVYDHLICYGQPCQPNTISMGLNTNIE